MTDFLKRHGISLPEAPIKIRNSAPSDLRQAIWSYAMQCGLSELDLTGVLKNVIPCEDFIPQRPINSMRTAWMQCDWPLVYVGIEHIAAALSFEFSLRLNPSAFAAHLNDFFRRHGFGWKLVDGKVEFRGPEAVETTIGWAQQTLAKENLNTASNELHEALKDLARKPEPDVTGAIQHAGAALECVAKEISGDPKKTFGVILNDYPDLFPKPLDEAAHKIWGFVSNNGRHIAEGVKPGHDVAYLVAGLVAALTAYLSDKRIKHKSQQNPVGKL